MGWGDIAGGIAHCLSWERYHHDASEMLVPRGGGWPTRAQWELFGVSVTLEHASAQRIRSSEWKPKWLEGAEACAPLREVFLEEPRREPSEVSADPCVTEATGERFETYRCQGQQQAIRSIFCGAEGTSVVVNLPTGMGKSLAAWAPAVMHAATGGMTLVIVPTIALAIDQAEQMMTLFAHVPGLQRNALLAWHSGLTDAERLEVKAKIAAGQQPILFTSPEAAISSLANVLHAASEGGRIRYFVIDEAHMVANWGAEFRPEFQSLAGFWHGLRAACPAERRFKTVFLTATLTQDSYDTLCSLFKQDEPLHVVSSAYLRPEPSYWMHKASSREDKIAKVSEAASRCPSPLIIYVTKQEDAEELHGILKERLGLHRIAHMHGDTDPARRQEILLDWKAGRLDTIVATSAFGLGMDKNDVRCVIHACVPESVDRYYQEVGRTGRDGKASASFLIYAAADEDVARSLANDRIISVDRGFERWIQMWVNRTAHDRLDDTYRLDLTRRPSGVVQDSRANIAWNLRTLMLLARAGILTLASERPPCHADGSTVSEEELERHYNGLLVSGVAERAVSQDFWASHIEACRQETRRKDQQAFSLMTDMLSGRRAFDEILCEAYSCAGVELKAKDQCGGNCPWARRRGIARRSYLTSYARPLPGRSLQDGSAGTARLLNGLGFDCFANPVFVTYDPADGHDEWATDEWRQKVFTFLRWFVGQEGVKELAVPGAWVHDADYRRLWRSAPDRFVLHADVDAIPSAHEEDLSVPRLSLTITQAIPDHLRMVCRPIHIVISRRDAAGDQPFRGHFDTRQAVTLDRLLENIRA